MLCKTWMGKKEVLHIKTSICTAKCVSCYTLLNILNVVLFLYLKSFVKYFYLPWLNILFCIWVKCYLLLNLHLHFRFCVVRYLITVCNTTVSVLPSLYLTFNLFKYLYLFQLQSYKCIDKFCKYFSILF